MAEFEIEAPNGQKYRVEGENAEGAVNALKKMLGGGSGATGMPPIGGLPSGMPSGAPFGMVATKPDDLAYVAEAPFRGLGNLAGAPFDLTNAALNLIPKTAAGVANWFLPDESEIVAPQLPTSAGSTIRNAAASAAEAVGIPVPGPEDVSLAARVAGNALDFGTQALLPGAGLAANASRAAKLKGVENLGPLRQAYAKKPIATTAVDTAAGAGAGVADQTAQEYDIENPFVRFLLASAGGWGGARLAQTAVAPYEATRAILDRSLLLGGRDRNVAPDTLLGVAVPSTRADTQAAARLMQETAIDPRLAAQQTRLNAAEARAGGITPPTSGQLSGDPGLLLLEKRARLGNPSKEVKDPKAGSPQFVERDRAVQQDLARRVRGLGPEDADPRAPTNQIAQELDALNQRRSQAEAGVAQAQAETAQRQSQIATEREQSMVALQRREQEARAAAEQAVQEEQTFGQGIKPLRAGQTAASETLATSVGEAKAADEARKRGLYQEAENLATGTVDARPYAAEVDRIKRDLQPLASQDKAIANAMPDFERLLDDTGAGAVGVRDLIQMLPRLSAVQKSAVANMRGDVAEAIGRISDRIKGDLTERAKQGDQAALAWSAAERNFQTQFAPKYREGVGRQLDQAERRGQPVPPSKQAGLFLKPHGGGKEAAADMNRILTGASSEAAGKAAARDYVMADLASLVPDSGVLAPEALRRWRDERAGMLSQIPEVSAEVDRLLVDVVNRRGNTNATKQALDAAVARRKETKLSFDRREKEVLANAKLNEKQKTAEIAKIDEERGVYVRADQDNAVRHLVGAEPRAAVANVMGSGDPERAMAQLVAKFSGNKDAAAGWKRAVSDWLYEKTTLAGAPDTTGGLDPVSLSKTATTLRKHRAALAKVYSPKEMNTLQRVEKFLDISARKGIGPTTGSQTAGNMQAVNLLELFLRSPMGLGNLRGGGAMRSIKLSIAQLPGTPKGARIDRLIERAMLDPELMQHLLTTPVRESAIPTWNRQLTRLLAARNTFAEGEE